MEKGLEKIISLKKKISAEYMERAEYSDYITGFGISEIDIKDKNASNKKDYCIRIYIKKNTPSHLKFPETYKGVKIYIKYSDEIILATN